MATDPFDPNPEQIDRWLPAGLKIVEMIMSPVKPAPLNAAITVGHYVFVPNGPLAAADLRRAVDTVRNSQTIPIVIERKDRKVAKDLRPLVHSIEYYSHGTAACIDAFLSMLPSKTCRPTELLSVMFPQKRFFDFLVRRVECLADGGSQLGPTR